MKKATTGKKTVSKPRRAPAKAKAAPPPGNRLLQLIVRALDDKKAADIRVFNVGQLSSITDYLVLATVAAEPHLRALRIELEKVIDAEKTKLLGIDTSKGSGWTVVDAFDVMVHLFTAENRERYRLDLLWKDAAEVSVESLLK
ncbi:MAG TPA: ribosome silencing factor [Candidatus Didemnitutus sp.]|nr:ribosome silencing factor [Candidatus Didemnitutus sp.]